MTLDEMVGLPWTWDGPRRVLEGDQAHYELAIKELPDFFVAGTTREDALAEAAPALRAFLQSYLEHDETPPLPDRHVWRITVLPSANATCDAVLIRKAAEFEEAAM